MNERPEDVARNLARLMFKQGGCWWVEDLKMPGVMPAAPIDPHRGMPDFVASEVPDSLEQWCRR